MATRRNTRSTRPTVQDAVLHNNGVSPTAPEPAAAAAVRQSAPALTDPSLYLNRELSLLAFQERVLEEAKDNRNPLLERVKFLSILGSNLDEFFMVRVAGLKSQVESAVRDSGNDGWSTINLLAAIRERVTQISDEAYQVYCEQLSPALAKAHIHTVEAGALSEKQRKALSLYFQQTVYPVLTPLAFDPGRPFPHISNLSLNLAVLVRDPAGAEHFARLKVPDSLPQLVPVEQAAGKRQLLWLEQLIAANLQALFPGMEVLESHPFHVTRDADYAIQELEADDLLEEIEEGVRQRRFGDVVRLQVDREMPEHMLHILMTNLEIDATDVYRVSSLPSLSRLRYVAALDVPELHYKPYHPVVPAALHNASEDDFFAAIRREDVLLHHPFDSFQPVVDLLKKAAQDPEVLAIKMTLYRVGRNSPVVEALLEATEEDTQVAVLVELKARFDEESNIEWARALEKEGVHVVYGLLGLKIHAKVGMVVRREGDTIRRYVHLGTGNYNAVTASLYTDISLLTCDEGIASDVTDLFNYLTGYSAKTDYQKLLVAPINLRERLEALIRREIALHQEHGKGRIIFKMNALEDARMIQLLYEASQAGVQVDLLVRGICCLRPGVPGVSETIRVVSIVGRFLEHSRIYWFNNKGQPDVYLGSADLMPRNLNRRVEVLFPIENTRLVTRVYDDILAVYLADNVRARHMQADGSYQRAAPTKGQKAVDSQAVLMSRASTARRKP